MKQEIVVDANPLSFFLVSVPPSSATLSHWPILEGEPQTSDGNIHLMLLGKCTFMSSAFQLSITELGAVTCNDPGITGEHLAPFREKEQRILDDFFFVADSEDLSGKRIWFLG